MPIYTFQCTNCDNSNDIMTKSDDYAERRCNECGRIMRRQFPTPSRPKFKGSGFYETDYKKKDKP